MPIPETPNKLFVKEIINKSGLTIVLANDKNEKEIITIYFAIIYGFRNLDESYHLRTCDENPVLTEHWTLFKSTGGDFIEGFNHLTYDIYKDDVINYLIVTSDDIVEILAHKNAEVLVTKNLIS